MITTAFENIASLVSANPKLQDGVDFMKLMRSEGILEAEKGLFPAICGGAVRDGLFTGREINDVDIFLFRDHRSQVGITTRSFSSSSRTVLRNVEEVKENLLSWLEDEGIEWRSLLSERAANYVQMFTEIIEFTWRDTRIQVMIPLEGTLSPSLDNLLRTMPIYSGVALTLEFLRMLDVTVASYYLPENTFFVGGPKDIPYLEAKFGSDIQLIPLNNSREATMYALREFTQFCGVGDGGNVDSILTVNSTTKLTSRAVCHKLGVDESTLAFGTSLPIHTL